MNAFYKTFFICVCVFVFSGCATIFGGAKYYAHVNVEGHPNASISYKGVSRGYGSATFKVPRAEANKFTITVSEENCEKQNFTFRERKIRGWPLAGTLLIWISIPILPLPLPLGLGVDIATGALWKPDIMEKGVSKIDHKHFNYVINNYSNCNSNKNNIQPNNSGNTKSKTERLFDLKTLLDKGILTQEEFDKEKKEILDEP